MSWTYAYYYWLDVISSPVFWFALGLGALPANIVWWRIFRRSEKRWQRKRDAADEQWSMAFRMQQERADEKYRQAAESAWADEVKRIWGQAVSTLAGRWPPPSDMISRWKETATCQENTEEKTE